MNLQLVRYCYGPDSVQGLLKVGEGNQLMTMWTLENPWQNNAIFVSCIPDGTYPLLAFDSQAHPDGDCWVLTPVPGRNGILIHVGNKVKDTQGCILVGQTQEPGAVWNSRAALRMLNFVLNRNEQHIIQIGSGMGAQLSQPEPVELHPNSDPDDKTERERAGDGNETETRREG